MWLSHQSNSFNLTVIAPEEIVRSVIKEVWNIPIVLPWKPPIKDKILSSGQPGAWGEETKRWGNDEEH